MMKGLVIDVNAVWEKILMKSKKCSEGLNAIYRAVEEVVENLVGKLGAVKIKVINAAHGDLHRLNRVYDLLGITYIDWPSPADDVGGWRKGRGLKRLERRLLVRGVGVVMVEVPRDLLCRDRLLLRFAHQGRCPPLVPGVWCRRFSATCCRGSFW